MTAVTVHSPLDLHARITLPELTDLAALQVRTDRKYVLPAACLGPVLHRLAADTRVLEINGRRTFRYHTVYFDTPELTSFRLAAYQRRRRFKIRTRTYLDSDLCWLEIKTEGSRGGTVKNRLPYRPDDQHTVAPGRSFLDETLTGYAGSEFTPTLVTTYRRTTFFLPASASRVTVDVDLAFAAGEDRLAVPGVVVVETKTGSAASAVDRLLWALGHRPARISKYATGLAALRPDLPATPWRRTLRRHFPTAG